MWKKNHFSGLSGAANSVKRYLINKRLFYLCKRWGVLDLVKNFLTKKYFRHSCFHLDVEISAQCNYDCRICGFQKFYQPKGLMSMETLLKLGDTFSKVNSVSFGFNAETLMNPKVVEMLKYVKKSNPYSNVTILTNASLLTSDLAEQLAINKLDDIKISLDAATPETYQKLRKYDWQKIISNIKELNRQKEKLKSDKPEISTTFVATKDNIHELLDFIDLARELKISSIRLTNVEPHTPEVRDSALYGDNYTEEIKEIIQEAKEKCQRFGINFSHPEFKKNEQAVCEFMHPIIDWQGNVIPCAQFSYARDTYYYGKIVHHSRIIMGNVNEKGFEEIWKSEAYRTFRNAVVKGAGPKFCYDSCLIREKVLCPK